MRSAAQRKGLGAVLGVVAGIKTDWSVALEVLGLVAAGGLVAVAARRLIHASAPRSELTADELWVLRRIEADGPLRWGFPGPNGDGTVEGWTLQNGGVFLKPESESKTNAHFSAVVRDLRRREMLDERFQVFTVNEASRQALRRDDRDVSPDRIRLEYFEL